MQQLRDELRICRRNMVAEQKNSGRVDKHVRKWTGELHGGLEVKDVKDHAAFFLRCDDGKNSYEVDEEVFVMGRECNPWNLRRFLSGVIATLFVAVS